QVREKRTGESRKYAVEPSKVPWARKIRIELLCTTPPDLFDNPTARRVVRNGRRVLLGKSDRDDFRNFAAVAKRGLWYLTESELLGRVQKHRDIKVHIRLSLLRLCTFSYFVLFSRLFTPLKSNDLSVLSQKTIKMQRTMREFIQDVNKDDDLIFDPEGKQIAIHVPLIETHQDDSFFHRIKRGVLDLITSLSTTTTTTTPPPSDQKEDNEIQHEDIDKSVILNVGDEGNRTFDQPEVPNAKTGIGVIQRLVLEKNEDNDEADENENEINSPAESQRIPLTYGNTDDEDLAGSGEIEGSAGEVDYPPNSGNTHRNTDGKARFYRITLTVGEPYRREYADRNSLEYRELSSNLTHAVENLYNRHIPGYNYFASVVKISPTTDAFTSQVTLDIGSTFTDEFEVRAILEQQLQYHSLGSIQVGPEGFTFRIFQAGEKDTQPECDQMTELRCRSGECVPLESRCDGVSQCNDSSDEDNCPTDLLNKTRDDFEYTTVTSQHPSLHFPTETTHTVNPEVPDIDDKQIEESTLRSSSNKCRADDTVRCQDGSRYICSVQQCDGVPDCDDSGDEIDCPHPGCSAGEFACDVNRCILESQRCNFVEDCQDGSDEHDCNYPGLSEIRGVHLRVHLADGSAPTLNTGRATSSGAERTPETAERSKRAKGLA
ncbi:Basement membrane-specific heparan sulfate proteoglycan core protein, partial [Cyphomyrmex costatus]